MICIEVNELMQLSLDGDISQSDTELLEKHLQACAECRLFYEKLQQIHLNLEQIPEIVPPYSIVDSILPELERYDLNKKVKKGSFFKSPFFYPIGIAAAGIIFILSMYGFKGGDPFSTMEMADSQEMGTASVNHVAQDSVGPTRAEITGTHADLKVTYTKKSKDTAYGNQGSPGSQGFQASQELPGIQALQGEQMARIESPSSKVDQTESDPNTQLESTPYYESGRQADNMTVSPSDAHDSMPESQNANESFREIAVSNGETSTMNSLTTNEDSEQNEKYVLMDQSSNLSQVKSSDGKYLVSFDDYRIEVEKIQSSGKGLSADEYIYELNSSAKIVKVGWINNTMLQIEIEGKETNEFIVFDVINGVTLTNNKE